MVHFIDRLRQLLFFKLTVIYLRYVIGFAFVFASFIKMRGERFTRIPVSEPVGYFFEAMYQTGFYWNFLGWAQFISGSLLVTQRFSTVGALVFLPVIANVFMITHSIDFGMGTPVITTLMLLGTIFLILWDYKKWVILFWPEHKIKLDLTKEPEDKFMTDPVWVVTGIAFVFFSALPWLTNWKNSGLWISVMILLGIVPFVIMMVRTYRRKLRVA